MRSCRFCRVSSTNLDGTIHDGRRLSFLARRTKRANDRAPIATLPGERSHHVALKSALHTGTIVLRVSNTVPQLDKVF